MTSPSPGAPAPAVPGLVLAAGPRAEVEAWASRTVVPLVTAPLGRWTAAVPRGESHVGAPYDDGMLLTAGRPLSAKAAPGIGFFRIDDRAVMTIHPAGRRREVRWVVWDPELGLLRPPGLPLAGPAEIVGIAGARADVRDELVELLHETQVSPRRMLSAVMDTLGLPGPQLLVDPAQVELMEGAVRHEPDGKQISWFEDAVKDSVRLRKELGAL